MGQERQEVAGQGIALAVAHVFNLLNEVLQVQLVHGTFPQAGGLLLRPSIQVLLIELGIGAHGPSS
jgi:hypothetical protein